MMSVTYSLNQIVQKLCSFIIHSISYTCYILQQRKNTSRTLKHGNSNRMDEIDNKYMCLLYILFPHTSEYELISKYFKDESQCILTETMFCAPLLRSCVWAVCRAFCNSSTDSINGCNNGISALHHKIVLYTNLIELVETLWM